MVEQDPLYEKTAVILGFARQGQALARFLPLAGARVIVSDKRNLGDLVEPVLDFSDSPVEYALGGHPIELLDEADVIFLSGGVDPQIPFCQEALRRGISLSNDAQVFLERCPATVIGVTGSAGKTTTTTLIGKMCEVAGMTTWVGGNIGDVLLDQIFDMASDHVVVMELSSFQLELMTRSPHIALVLNVTPNHLDRHGSMDDYMAAKAHIFLHQAADDVAIFSYDDPGAHVLSRRAPGQALFFSARDLIADGAFLAGNRLMVVGGGSPDRQPHVVCTRDDIRLRGEHNVRNVLAACAAAGAVGVPVDVMRQVIREFAGVQHRLEIVRVVGGVMYVNDSIATAPERVIAALNSFSEPIILLAGGRDKKLPWDEMAVLTAQKVKGLVTFGEHGPTIANAVRLAQTLQPGRLETIQECATLDDAVRHADELADPGDVVLLSPGGTSYDAYEDFAERGDHFRTLVNALEERKRG